MSLLRRFALSQQHAAPSARGPTPGPQAPPITRGDRLVEYREQSAIDPRGLLEAWQRAGGEAGEGVVVFVDTETTGLSHSQLPFVLGALALDLRSGHMELLQWALREREAEVAMLRRFDAWLSQRRVHALSSFNGASFDLPLLRRRTRRLGLPLPSALRPEAPHLDLLHLGRRLWRDRLPDCRLVTFEAKRLGRRRQGDIPSALIPAVFTDYLANPSSAYVREQLARVEHHNRLDLWSLPELLVDFGRTLSSPEGWTERLRAGRHFIDRGALDDARASLERGLLGALRGAQVGELRHRPALRHVALEAAALARKRGDRLFEGELLSQLQRSLPSDPEVCRRYAILLEHQDKNFAAALEVAASSRDPEPRRIARLRERLAKQTQAAPGALDMPKEVATEAVADPTFSSMGGDRAVRESGVISSPSACVPRVTTHPASGVA